MYSQENTADGFLFRAVAGMWTQRDSITDAFLWKCKVLQNIIFTEHCWVTASDIL